MANELDEKFVSDDGVSTVEDPSTTKFKKNRADKDIKVNPNADEVEDLEGIKESFEGLFEGTDLSEEFKAKAMLVFESAVNEAAKEKALVIAEEFEEKLEGITEELEEQFGAQLEASIAESMEEIIENLDNYLDYVVENWMAENELAVESGIKVEMAESFMSGLKSLFEEHNVDIDEEAVDVVAALEEETEAYRIETNNAINENIALKDEILGLKAHIAFEDVAEGLTTSQTEKLRSLSENLDVENIEAFKSNVKTLKESFFNKKAQVMNESFYNQEDDILVETVGKSRVSSHDSINAIVAALDAKRDQ